MALKTDTFGVPLKKASEIDVLKPLKNVITSRYQTHEQESFISAINEFSKLRSSTVARSLDFHEASLELMYRYYDQIVALETKIPGSEIAVPFKWRDAFDKGSIFGSRISLTVSSLSYEKVCVLFNVAALQSQVAAAQSCDSDEALKLAAKLFQSAAGIFTYLKGIVHGCVQQDPTPDLQPDTLTALSALMVAQAQEVITVKAIKDNMKDAIVAKLAAQCEELYAEAVRVMQKELLKPLWEREWTQKVAGKQSAYAGLAQYYESRICHTEKTVGEEISRLRVAMDSYKLAATRACDPTFFADHSGRCQRALDEAVKDNDFIYHERIPDAKALVPIGKAVVAKATSPPDRFTSNFCDLFESLVPVAVQQALTQYDNRKQEIINGDIGLLKEATQMLNAALASLNLPAAIEDIGGEQLPQSLREKSRSMCESGGIKALEKMIEELPDLLTRNRELLDECDRMLSEERNSDDQLRTQFKEKWNRVPSEKLTSSFLTNAEKYRKVIETAIQADVVVRGKFSLHEEGMRLLSSGPDALASALPSITASSSSKATPAIQKLRQLMEEVETMKAEREVIQSEMTSATIDMRDVFLSALAQDGGINEPALSAESLGRVFGPLQKQVRESLQKQEALVSAIQSAHTDFSHASSGLGGDRESMLKRLAAAFDSYTELRGNLTEGAKFYNDLTQLLVNFQGKISDLCFARKTEKEELMRDLTQGLANPSLAATPTPPAHYQDSPKVPPPRPPPPTTQNPYQGAPQNPYQGAPQLPQNPYQGAPQPPQNPYQGAPPNMPNTGALPYPVNPQGMPIPQGNPYPGHVYTPMPAGYNPYYQTYPGAYAAAPYPQQPYPGYPYPQQAPQQQWPPK